MDLNLIHSPDSYIRRCILATLSYLSQHESISAAVLELKSFAQLVALHKREYGIPPSKRLLNDSYGGYVSPPAGLEVIGRDRRQMHRQVEARKHAKAMMAYQVKVLLIGSGDSGKSTLLKKMRLWHIYESESFSAQEIESYRQHVFGDLTRGLQCLLDAFPDMDLQLPPVYTYVYPEDDPQHRGGYVKGWAPGEGIGLDEDSKGVKPDKLSTDVELIKSTPDLCDGEPFPLKYLGPLQRLWGEEVLRFAWARRNETGLQEDLQYFFSDLPRLFDPAYVPTSEDILHTRERTTGIMEMTIKLLEHEILLIDVSGQRSERRKWTHCFQDVTSILFFVNLSWYDQCLFEDRNVNRMQDAMTIWDSICNSPWLKQTSIILVLTEYDIFQEKIKRSEIRTFFPVRIFLSVPLDFDGEPENAVQGRDYFKKRFRRLARKAGPKDREICVHTTNTGDTEPLVVLSAVGE
ncbi:heterotrimeric G protein alpha subunit 4 [Mycena pura]|uniref:Heterotrimeric G protein alpha subunit 4 n=1 Tax=Mycena pura TaxID=153505 RepID=A0AAD6YAG6_9AGAR|nr:heterotrimeric G protein alpha subunit 4 [Mycena pura]